MSTNSTIEWTETTWNPTTGCDRISPGCDNCYALALAKRLKAMGSATIQGRWRSTHQRPRVRCDGASIRHRGTVEVADTAKSVC